MSTIPVSSLFVPKTPAQWLAQTLADAQTQGLTSTSWQSGDPILTILAIMAEELAKEDSLGISLRAQGAFLDFAASGSVTIVDDLVAPPTSITVPVTPDPSIPGQNPTGAPGLLDTLASSTFGVLRGQASSASGPLYLTNTSGVSIGTFPAGTFHVQNVATRATYSSQFAFTFSASSIIGTSVTAATATSPVAVTTSTAHGLTTGAVVFAKSLGVVADNFYTVTVTGANTVTLNGSVGFGSFPSPPPPAPNLWTATPITFAADLIGPGGNAGVGQINQLVTAAPLSYCGNLQTFSGAPWQSNVSLAALCRAKQATLNPNGPAGAYVFFAMLAYTILQGGTVNSTGLILTSPIPSPVTLDGGPVTRALVGLNTATGTVTVTVANAGGAVAGTFQNVVNTATAASPIVVGTATPHGLVTGDWVQINGGVGLAGLNGRAQVTFVDASHVSLNGTTGTGAYTGGSALLNGGDIYTIGAVIQAYATPNCVSSVVISAGNVATLVAATVYVPASFVADYLTKMTAALTAYFTSFPIGGLNVDGLSNILPISAIEGILFSSGQSNGAIYTFSVAILTLNGAPNDLSLGPTGVAILGVLTGINVVGV